MEFLQLKYFKTVAQTLNFTQASKQLYISQSSLSQTIRHLEKELGYSLFNRNGRKISLNENGMIFLRCVDKIDDAIETAKKELALANSSPITQLSLSMQCASHKAPRLFRMLSEQFPDIRFLILQGSGNADADLRIIASPYPLDKCNRQLLLQERLLLAVPLSSPLCKHAAIYAKDLINEPFLALSNNWSLGRLLQHHFDEIHFVPSSLLVLDNPSLMREFLQEGFHIAFIPEITWKNSVANPSYIVRPVEDISMKRYVYLEWDSSIHLSDTIKLCISAIQDYFNDSDDIQKGR